MEGVTFLVKYLGKEAVENDNEEEETTAAIKDIITKVIIYIRRAADISLFFDLIIDVNEIL